MSDKGKKIFLALTIVVPFLIYCVVYYTPMFKNAPFKLKEFESIDLKWGMGNNLENSYNSATGDYQYVNGQDSLIKTNVKLRKDDILYLHSKASELGFWNFPDVLANRGTNVDSSKVLRYVIQFNYKKKSKTVIYLTDYNEIPKLKGLAEQMKTLLQQSINDAEERYGKQAGSKN
ncbi:hypothetical protein FBD94_08500 [Pedobacter hiemivivus]|jgi:hypothetical protein|uniref:Uncharacterized protein n=1 Tax=Pedobacter hiemivivus TaxID=2530454 RepID=A0A4R0MKI4_9SPHI|nr:hypothetical protein [Pedobacter hiemivivus]TCC86722.1 hypothetical protein EZ444_23320 [Pedobacter hiemivivus]TKC62253.1 hypothetical protein FBD94_08500 [Pedobacter hiemivivus]